MIFLKYKMILQNTVNKKVEILRIKNKIPITIDYDFFERIFALS